jgi:hypothetical protein
MSYEQIGVFFVIFGTFVFFVFAVRRLHALESS